MENINKVIILGSAALKIGEAGEFDYSGSQAIKALRSENVTTILINPNIATVQTDEELADRVYLLPVTPKMIERVIEREKPDGILLAFGGQTALNCGIQLQKTGVLKRHQVRVLGTPVEVIESTEDRNIFRQKLNEIDAPTPRNIAAHTVSEAEQAAEKIGYPVMMRIAFALGGLGSGVCRTPVELKERAVKALNYAPQILIEEYLEGWKEVEYEVVRDSYDNCITVCNMENLDPLGIHTGESIVVAPSQTLDNNEYHSLRSISIRTVRHLGVVGECNVQFALNPQSDECRIIEVNARLSRSSALASKATGYPLAYIAAKIALGYSLPELTNAITRSTMACFEPALDYVTVKIPRWDLSKFSLVSKRLGSNMKSVGEVMSIGRTFNEALQKALRMLDTGANGLIAHTNYLQDYKTLSPTDLETELQNPTDERVFLIAHAFDSGMSLERIHELTFIDKWFLAHIRSLVRLAGNIEQFAGGMCPKSILLKAKQNGFSDKQIAILLKSTEYAVRRNRHNFNIKPYVKQIDTLAGEYAAQTNYLYLSYNATEDDVKKEDRNSIFILGSGVYRIGSSVEFDWCCVNALKTIKEENYGSILINCNPETVSTDYDQVDRLYFDEISLETVLEIYEKEQPKGVIVSKGGQTSNNLALPLLKTGVRVLGTHPEQIDRAEDRHKFSSMLDSLGVDQPQWKELSDINSATGFAGEVGYPVLVRPSYVLSGSAMAVATDDKELQLFLKNAINLNRDHPVVVTKFHLDTKEIEFDGVACNGELILYAVSEHVENAGVHSGDATLVLPAQRTYLETLKRIRHVATKIARELNITGPFNIQFLAKDNSIKVIECNLRASRSFPFISKVTKKNFIKVATYCMLHGKSPIRPQEYFVDLDYVGIKASQFSFTRLIGADPSLRVEMSSTGEVGCIGADFNEALLKSLLSVGYKIPLKTVLLSSGPQQSKVALLEVVKQLTTLGAQIYATKGTHDFLKTHQIETIPVRWPDDPQKPDVLDILQDVNFDLVINIPKSYAVEEINNDYQIRRSAADLAIPIITNVQLAKRFIEAVSEKSEEELSVVSWNEY